MVRATEFTQIMQERSKNGFPCKYQDGWALSSGGEMGFSQARKQKKKNDMDTTRRVLVVRAVQTNQLGQTHQHLAELS